MQKRMQKNKGFSLIELLIVIIVMGIAMAVGMQWMGASVDDFRRIKTEREMVTLSSAIVGNPDLHSNGKRSDFGYIGDIGAFPPNLNALYQNPGGYSTWDGPYLPPEFAQNTAGYKFDEWGKAYVYTGGITITSNGSGSAVTKKIADASSDYLLNSFIGVIKDADDSLPGTIYRDSIDIKVTIPNGSGGTLSKIYNPDSAGVFRLDSLPAGTHPLEIIYIPNNDTLSRFVTILPRNKSNADYKFADISFPSGGGGGGCDSSGTVILRPNGVGAKTELTRGGGCGANWECVDEVSSDGNATRVRSSGSSYLTDTYTLIEPPSSTCNINKITVYGRAKKTTIFIPGYIKPVIRIDGAEYEGPEQLVTNSYSDYGHEWAINPSTGQAWTWSDIEQLEAGISLSTISPVFRVDCTQVWVEVDYEP